MILDNVDDRSVIFGNNDVVRGISPHDQATDSQPPLETFPLRRETLVEIPADKFSKADLKGLT